MKEKKAANKSVLVILCVVLVFIMLMISAVVLRSGYAMFLQYGRLQLIHHGAVPFGYTACEEHYEDGFMDYTDYCQYYYTEETDSVFAADSTYEKVQEKDREKVRDYFLQFESILEGQGRSSEFHFDSQCISSGDYVYIETREGQQRTRESTYGKYDFFSVYFYDKESHILYYVHNNG